MTATAPSPGPRPWRTRAKRLLGALALLSVSFLFAAVLGEIVVRVAAPQQLIVIRPDIWEGVDTVGWRMRANVDAEINTGERTVRLLTDGTGYRVGTAGRRDGEVRVLLIGDSFVEAIQVDYEQTFGHLLERELEGRLGRPVVVRNAGTGGYSPDQYLIRARQLVPTEPFDLLVVAVFVGNDAIRNPLEYYPPRQATARRSLRFPRGVSPHELVDAVLAPVNDMLEVRSHFFVLVKNQLAGLRMKLGMTADYFPGEFLLRQRDSDRWAITARTATRIDSLARAHGARALFVLVPDRLQISPDDLHRYAQGFGIDSSQIDLEQPSRLLRQSFDSAGLAVIDPLEAFREAAKARPRLYGVVDPHLSPDGHEVLAASLVEPVSAVLTAPRVTQGAAPGAPRRAARRQ